MKKTIVILLVLVTTGAFLSAQSNGRKSNDRRDDNRDDRRGEMMDEYLEDATIVSITGTLKLVNGEIAKLVSDKITYSVMAPWDQLIELKVKDGMKVTLEGVERVAPMMWDESEKTFIVTKITINGKTTEINHDDRGGMMGYGNFGGGMMGGRNKGNGFRN